MLDSAKKTQFGGVNEDNTNRFGVLRPGIVSKIDTKRHTVKVKWLDQEIESFWLPVLKTWTGSNKHYALPDLGDQVICLTDYTQEDGIVLGSIYSDADVPPIDDQNKTHLQWADKTYMEYDRKEHVSRMINQDPDGTSLLQVGDSLLYHWGNQGKPLGAAGPLAFIMGCNDVIAQLNVLIPPPDTGGGEGPSPMALQSTGSEGEVSALAEEVAEILKERFVPVHYVSLMNHTHDDYGYGPPVKMPSPYFLPDQVLPSELTLDECKSCMKNTFLKQDMAYVPELEGEIELVKTQFEMGLDQVEGVALEVVDGLEEPLKPMSMSMLDEAMSNARSREKTTEDLANEFMGIYDGTASPTSSIAQALSPLIQRIKEESGTFVKDFDPAIVSQALLDMYSA